MRYHRQTTAFERMCAYMLVVTVTLMYTPLYGFQSAQAAGKAEASLHILPFETYKGETPEDVKVMVEEEVGDKVAREKRIALTTKKELRDILSGGGSKGIKGTKNDLDTAKEHLDEAREAYEADEYLDAQEAAKDAIKSFKRCVNLIDDWDEVKEAYVIRATAAVRNEENEEDAIGDLLVYNYYLKTKRLDYGTKEFRTMFKAQKKTVKKNRATLTVQAEPSDAVIFINGKEDDKRKLVKGTHFVQVIKEGYEPYGQLVELNKTTTHKVTLTKAGAEDVDYKSVYKDLRAKARNKEFDENFVELATQLSEAVPVQYLAFGLFESSSKTSRVTPYVFRASDGQIVELDSRTLKHNFADVDKENTAIAQDIKDAILKNFPLDKAVIIGAPVGGYYDEPAPADTPPPVEDTRGSYDMMDLSSGNITLGAGDVKKNDQISGRNCRDPEDPNCQEVASDPKKPIYEEWWFWTIIGVVAIGGVVGTAVALQPEDQNRPSTVTLPSR